MLMIRDVNHLFQRMSGMPVNSRDGQKLLKKAGIDTNSRQYKAVISEMGGAGYTNAQAIKNRMKLYDKEGHYIEPKTGLADRIVPNGKDRK